MNISSEVEAAARSKGLNYVYGNLNETNLGLDLLKANEYPVCILLPPVVNDDLGTSGKWSSQAPMFVYYMDRIPAATVDYKSGEVEDTIKRMRTLSRQVVMQLNHSELIDKDQGLINRLTHTPQYGEFDDHVFGVLTQFNFPVNEGTTCSV